MLNEVKWKSVYRSGDQNLLKEFYLPSLKQAVSYDRAVGFFSASTLVANLEGVSELVKNGGSMRLVIGHPLEEDEYLAIKKGYEVSKLLKGLETKLEAIIEECKGVDDNKLDLLTLLISRGLLEVKFALRRKGMYHEKIGIIRDKADNCLVFQGSANETIYALDEGYNAESIMVFKSWGGEFEDYGKPCIEGFDNLWSNNQKQTITVDMPSSFYEEICKEFPPKNAGDSTLEEHDRYFLPQREGIFIPKEVNGNPFNIYEHQKSAIKKWWASDNKGILKLATGSGKTITSLVAASKVFESRGRLILIIAVPYIELANQWVENLKLFDTCPIKCWGSSNSWSSDVDSAFSLYKLERRNFISLVVVNKTLTNQVFQEKIKKIDTNHIMLIGDECHNLGAEKVNKSLPGAYFRLGLSATPFRSDDDEIDSPFPDESRGRLLEYFGGIVDKYTLEDAINDGVLCGYSYKVVPVRLTEEEQDEFDEISLNIAKLIIKQKATGLDSQQRSSLTTLCGKRSMLLGSASNKFIKLQELVKGIKVYDRRHTLFYCGVGKVQDKEFEGDEKVIEKTSGILKDEGWRTSRFTSVQSPKERVERMSEFEAGVIDALVSIRVLDEGVDVPVCKTAIIMASTRNPRQYVQRRGRVLRKAKGKEEALIYDFVVLPSKGSNSNSSKKLLEAELERVDDFCMLANNKNEVEKTINELGMRDEY